MSDRTNMSHLEVRLALESAILRLRRWVWASLSVGILGLILVIGVLPQLQGMARKLLGTMFGLFVALGFLAAFSCGILIFDRRSGLKEIQRDEGEQDWATVWPLS